MAGECDVLVGVSGFPVDIKIKGAVRTADDGDVKHGDPIVFLNFFCPLNVRMYGVKVVVGGDSVVGFSVPEQNDLTGTDVVVASRVVGKGCSLEVLHVDVGQWAAG